MLLRRTPAGFECDALPFLVEAPRQLEVELRLLLVEHPLLLEQLELACARVPDLLRLLFDSRSEIG
jgi:hypothetical protein